MKKAARDTEILDLVEEMMPTAARDEKLLASYHLWEFFDAIWLIADRVIGERETLGTRDKPGASATVDTHHDL